jgi:CHAD domain-containing protein
VRHTIPSLILTVFESVRAYETVFEDGALPSLETFHDLRIRAKNLRYVLEFTEHLLGKDIGPILTLLRDLQDHLGQLNDAYVEQQRLQQWAARTRDTKIQGSDSLSAAIETRLALLAPHIDELAAATPERLTNFVRSANRLRLARAIARL